MTTRKRACESTHADVEEKPKEIDNGQNLRGPTERADPVDTGVVVSQVDHPATVDINALVTQLLHVIGAGRDPFAKRYRNFVFLGGEKFSGTGDALEAMDWLTKCSQIFERMKLTSVEQRELAVHALTGDALNWWRSLELYLNMDEIGWEEFKARFEAMYLSPAVQMRLSVEFENLRQSGKPVTEYVTKFYKLARFGQYLVATKEMKNEKFIYGCDHHLSIFLLPFKRMDFDEIVGLATEYEARWKSFRSDKVMKSGPGGPSTTQRVQSANRYQHHRGGRGEAGTGSNRGGFRDGFDRHCGGFVQGHVVAALPEQVYEPVVCWACGQLGHYHNDCPALPEEECEPVVCWTCGQPGHYHNDCPALPEEEYEPVVCWTCGQPGHYHKDCPALPEQEYEPVVCWTCGQPGHYHNHCPDLPEQEYELVVCWTCGQPGHYRNHCPQERGHQAVVCWECGQQGHFCNQCPERQEW